MEIELTGKINIYEDFIGILLWQDIQNGQIFSIEKEDKMQKEVISFTNFVKILPLFASCLPFRC